MSDGTGRAFGLDKRNAKLGGVCAGFAASHGLHLGVVRSTAIVLAVMMPPAVLAYFALWVLLPDRSMTTIADRRGGDLREAELLHTTAEAWARYRLVEVRMARIEAYYTSNNTSLARQIEALAHDAPISEAATIAAARAQMRSAATTFGKATR